MEGTSLSLSINSGPSFNLTVIITHMVAGHNLRWNCPEVFAGLSLRPVVASYVLRSRDVG